MRQVTRKPPNILIEAMMMAIKLTTETIERSFEAPSAIIAPTITTPEIALVTAIKGVCKAGVTFHTTKYPTKQAKIKTAKPKTSQSTEP